MTRTEREREEDYLAQVRKTAKNDNKITLNLVSTILTNSLPFPQGLDVMNLFFGQKSYGPKMLTNFNKMGVEFDPQ
jgi:hypothetical protein